MTAIVAETFQKYRLSRKKRSNSSFSQIKLVESKNIYSTRLSSFPGYYCPVLFLSPGAKVHCVILLCFLSLLALLLLKACFVTLFSLVAFSPFSSITHQSKQREKRLYFIVLVTKNTKKTFSRWSGKREKSWKNMYDRWFKGNALFFPEYVYPPT